jgi:hypothetical protein
MTKPRWTIMYRNGAAGLPYRFIHDGKPTDKLQSTEHQARKEAATLNELDPENRRGPRYVELPIGSV